MRIFIVILVLAISSALAASASAQRSPAPQPDARYPSESEATRETLPGALERADRRLDIVNRGTDLQRQNQGANGRKNATRDAVEDAEVPRAARSGYSPW